MGLVWNHLYIYFFFVIIIFDQYLKTLLNCLEKVRIVRDREKAEMLKRIPLYFMYYYNRHLKK